MDETKIKQAMRSAFQMTKQRCYNLKCRDYPSYGGRGITVCDRWLASTDNMIADMGLRPRGMTLERKDNEGPYSPSNCVWATRKAQASNTRSSIKLTHNGRTQTLSEWSKETGVAYHTLKARVMRLGYTPEQALRKSVKFGAMPEGRTKPRHRPDMSRVPRGINHKLTSLSAEQVLRMREMYLGGGETFTSLAKKFNVCIETSSNAVQALGAYKDVT